MEKNNSQASFLDSKIYEFPEELFKESLRFSRLAPSITFNYQQLLGRIEKYFHELMKAENPKDDSWQDKMKPLLEELLVMSKNENSGDVFKSVLAEVLHVFRIFTEHRGYGANEGASRDVDTMLNNPEFQIPDTGVIVLENFVTRNLPKVVELCKKQNIDLSRIRVIAPRSVLLAQLMKLDPEKRKAFEEACSALHEDQFISKFVGHSRDLKIEEPVAVWIGPRALAISPQDQYESVQETVDSYMDVIRGRVSRLVIGGIAMLSMAGSAEHTATQVEEKVTPTRKLLKLTGVSQAVCAAILEALMTEGSVSYVGEGVFNPEKFDPQYAGKMVEGLIVRRVNA